MVKYYNLRYFCVPTKKITAWLVQSKIIGSKTFLSGIMNLHNPGAMRTYDLSGMGPGSDATGDLTKTKTILTIVAIIMSTTTIVPNIYARHQQFPLKFGRFLL